MGKGFYGNTIDNLENESCHAIELIDIVVTKVRDPRSERKREGEQIKKTSEDTGRGYTLDELIDRSSPLIRTKKKIINEPNPDLPYYMKLTYPTLKKKPEQEKEDGQFKKPMENVTKHQVNVPFGESVEKMMIGSKFKKYLLTEKRKVNHDEKITVTKECIALFQRKLPPNLKD